MTQTIHVPEGEDGDEVVAKLIPSLHKMAQGKQNSNRSGSNG